MALIKCPSCRAQISKKADACPHCGHPISRRRGGLGGCLGALIFLVLVAIAFGVLSNENNKGNIDPRNQLHDVVQDKQFLAQNPNFLETTRKFIVSSGYECPRINILWAKGPSPNGPKFEAFCGPASGTGIYEAMHYAVYPQQLKVTVCKPKAYLAMDAIN